MQSLFIKWIIKGLFFILLVVTTCAILLVVLPVNRDSYLAAIPDRHKLLESTPGSRVIVAGGSNVTFGLDSERLSGLLHKPVIDDSFSAGLGMRFTLNDLAPFIHSGDIVVLAPEYENFFNDYLEGDNQTLALLLNAYPQAIQSFEAPQYVRLLDFYIPMLRSKFLYLTKILIDPSKANDVYTGKGFNRYGDQISHLGMPSDPNIVNSAFITESESYNLTAIEVFNRFAKQTEAKGARIYLVYPSSRNTNCIATQARFEQFDNYLRADLEFPILDHPRDSCFADKYFYDTQYHLNAEGRELRTLQLAKLLIDHAIVKVGLGDSLPSK